MLLLPEAALTKGEEILQRWVQCCRLPLLDLRAGTRRSWDPLLPTRLSTRLRGETNEAKVEDRESLVGATTVINRIGTFPGPYDLYQVTTRTTGRVEAVEVPVARTKVATLVIVEDQKRNEALRGLGVVIDAHEKSMRKEGVTMTMTEKVEDTKDAVEDLQ